MQPFYGKSAGLFYKLVSGSSATLAMYRTYQVRAQRPGSVRAPCILCVVCLRAAAGRTRP